MARKLVLFAALLAATLQAQDRTAGRPNILWLVAEDLSPKLGCYGTADAHTPNLDALAERGVVYDRAFATSGVCAPARSCLITGVYPSSIGTQFMRCKGRLPPEIRFFTEHLRDAGYYCANRSKTDYNLPMRDGAWDASSGRAHYKNRAPGQPFFQVVNFNVTHESKIRAGDDQFAKLTRTVGAAHRHDPADVVVPPFYPDTPIVRRDLARHLDLQTALDHQVARWLRELEERGVADDTIVFFYSDHGDGLPRCKRWIYDSGTRVPLIVSFPSKFAHLAPSRAGTRTDRLVSFVDFGATVLSLAGLSTPGSMHGRAFLGEHAAPPREFVYAIRDRMDERYDLSRGVRGKRFHYIRNYMPERPYAQRIDYLEKMPTMQELRRLLASPRAEDSRAPLRYLAEKPCEELYDTQSDPWEVHNLADSPTHRDQLERMRREHVAWCDRTRDVGVVPEHELREQTEGRTVWEWALANDAALRECRSVARAISGSLLDREGVRALIESPDPVIRFWGSRLAGDDGLRILLEDQSPDVRIAAATRLGRSSTALGRRARRLLVDELSRDGEWRRLAAANALTSLGSAVVSLRDEVDAARKGQGGYVSRVLDALVPVLERQSARTRAAERTTLRPIDVFDLEYANDPQISPDGRFVVYARTFMDVMIDRRRSNLWIVDRIAGTHRALTSGKQNDSAPRWSPDGGKLLFVSNADGSPQLWMMWMDTRQRAKLAQLPFSPSGLSWSPDGESIAFSMHVPSAPKSFAKMPKQPEGAQWAPPPRVVDKVTWRRDGSGYVRDGYSHLFVLGAAGGTPRQVTMGDFHHVGAPSWRPDGGALVFSANRRADWEHEPRDTSLFEVDLTTGEIEQLTERYGPESNPAVSPSGDHIAYLGFDDDKQGYQVTKLHVMDRDGGNVRILCDELDRDIARPTWSGDGKQIYFQFDDEGHTKIARSTLDGRIQTLADDAGGLSLGRPYSGASFSVARDGHFAYTRTDPMGPADVAVGEFGGTPVSVTALNDDVFAAKKLGEVEEFWCESSHDQRRVQGWIVKPPDFDPSKRYPLILEIHGGPFANYGARFAAEMQLYAAAGYVVLYANPRGSTSYGQEFGNAIHHAYPGYDYDDLISCVDAVLAKGYVDADRLFVTGGSGGGVLTAWIVGKTDRFRAAVVQKPVINWYSFVLTADSSSFFTQYWFPGPPWEHAAHYAARSPISLVGNVKTPTMLLTGEEDLRTPIGESEQFYQALKLRKVDTALVRVPGASHGIANRPSQLIAKVAHVLAWFERYDAGMESRVRTEIEELHAFFEAWFNGTVERSDEVYARFLGVLHEEFEIVSPSGAKLAREDLLAGLHGLHGRDRAAEILIEVRNVRSREIGPGLLLVTYEEWQTKGGASNGRLSTAVMRERADAPNGFEWVHVHEVALPE